jgi:integrase
MLALTALQSLSTRGVIAPTRLKDIRTSLNKLAAAYQIPVDELDLAGIEATYPETLKTFFAEQSTPASVHTIRNTQQNIKQLLRQAHQAALLGSAARPKTGRRRTNKEIRAAFVKGSPYNDHYFGRKKASYTVPMDQWPDEIRQGWQRYEAEKSLQIRQSTLRSHRLYFTSYVGYNLTVDAAPITRWDQIFETDRLKRCLGWLAARLKVSQVSSSGEKIVIVVTDIAKHLERPEYATLQKLKRQLPKPTPIHDKKRPRHTITLRELDQAGLTMLAEARQPLIHRTDSGARRAVRFQTALIIRLLTRCPRRQREIREMDLDGRLYRDEAGVWQLHYRSDQLKIAVHDGAPNEFRMPWPPDLVDDLEEYLQVFRPRIPNSAMSPLVFPTERGRQLTESLLGWRITLHCYRLTGKHVFPHLFRTLWCDAYLDAHPGDFEGAAAMLNDRPQTVQGWYRQFRVEQQLKKAIDFNAFTFGHDRRQNGHPKRTSR